MVIVDVSISRVTSSGIPTLPHGVWTDPFRASRPCYTPEALVQKQSGGIYQNPGKNDSKNPPACRRVWLEGVVPCFVHGLSCSLVLFLWVFASSESNTASIYTQRLLFTHRSYGRRACRRQLNKVTLGLEAPDKCTPAVFCEHHYLKNDHLLFWEDLLLASLSSVAIAGTSSCPCVFSSRYWFGFQQPFFAKETKKSNSVCTYFMRTSHKETYISSCTT